LKLFSERFAAKSEVNARLWSDLKGGGAGLERKRWRPRIFDWGGFDDATSETMIVVVERVVLVD
jgi:hypothetical protein